MNDGTITVNSGTLQADGDEFTNAGSIVDNGAFDADPTKFLVTTGSESGSTAAGVVLEGGTFEDSLSAGAGTFTTGGGITLGSADLPSPEVPGVPSGQTLDILNQNASNNVTFTDSGIVNVTSNGGTGYIQGVAATDGFTVASGGALNLIAASTDTAYVGYVGSLTIDSGANLSVTGSGTGELWNAVTTVNDGTITVNSGATLQADGDGFTNAGSIVDNGAFDADPTKFLVTTGSESGSTAAGVVLEGGLFEDSLSAGGGTYTTGGGITLSGVDLPSPEVPGVPSGQTLDIINQNTGNDVTNFTDSGVINVTANGGTGYIQDGAASDGLTVASGGALNLTAASTDTAYVGYVGSLTIDSGANLSATGPGTDELWNAVTTVNEGTITVNSGATFQADGAEFTNAGSIVDNGSFDADPTKFLVTTGSESGSTAAGVVLEGGLFEDSLSAGGGTYTTGGGITLSGADLPSPEVPGVPSGQTLDIINQNTGNDVTNFTDSGTINVTSNGGTGYIQDGAATDGLTVTSGGQLNLNAAASATAYVGYVGSLTIDRGANLSATGPGTSLFWNAVSVVNNGTITVHDNASLSIGDDFTQGEFGTLAVTSDVTASTRSVITGGTDTLDGTLDVTTIGSPPVVYSPISSASSRTGEFGTLNYNGVDYSTAYSSSAVTLTPSSTYDFAGLDVELDFGQRDGSHVRRQSPGPGHHGRLHHVHGDGARGDDLPDVLEQLLRGGRGGRHQLDHADLPGGRAGDLGRWYDVDVHRADLHPGHRLGSTADPRCDQLGPGCGRLSHGEQWVGLSAAGIHPHSAHCGEQRVHHGLLHLRRRFRRGVLDDLHRHQRSHCGCRGEHLLDDHPDLPGQLLSACLHQQLQPGGDLRPDDGHLRDLHDRVAEHQRFGGHLRRPDRHQRGRPGEGRLVRGDQSLFIHRPAGLHTGDQRRPDTGGPERRPDRPDGDFQPHHLGRLDLRQRHRGALHHHLQVGQRAGRGLLHYHADAALGIRSTQLQLELQRRRHRGRDDLDLGKLLERRADHFGSVDHLPGARERDGQPG